MRHNAQARRMRGRNNHGHSQNNGGQRRGFQNKNRVFDSNGPDVRIRGTAYQIVEKYAALAKDASATGDWVLAESYLQHAEHYQRMINEWGVEEAEHIHSHGSSDMEEGVVYDRFSMGQQQPAGTGPQPAAKPQEDLGLPSSILGAPRAELAEA